MTQDTMDSYLQTLAKAQADAGSLLLHLQHCGEELPRPEVSRRVPTTRDIDELELLMQGMDGQLNAEDLTDHEFCDGLYRRTLSLPAGALAVGKVHASENFFIVLSGTVLIASHGRIETLHAGSVRVTKPGMKRVAYALTAARVCNIHPNPHNIERLEELEAFLILPGKAVTA